MTYAQCLATTAAAICQLVGRRRFRKSCRRTIVGLGCCLTLIFALPGCASNIVAVPRQPDHEKNRISELAQWWQPWLTYIQAGPYDRLHVEIDAIEGCVAAPESIAKLKAFLELHLHKPGGMEVMVGAPTPREQASGLDLTTLAIATMDGPPRTSGDTTAYMHILYYDSDLLPKGHSYSHDGHVIMLPYPAQVYVNGRSSRYLSSSDRDYTALHEVGHLLGLATHGEDGTHCTDPKCLMYGNLRISFGSLFGFAGAKNTRLCAATLEQLETSRTAGDGANTIWSGPSIVREEQGYCVATLPGLVMVVFGDAADVDGWSLLEHTKREALNSSATRASVSWSGWNVSDRKYDKEAAARLLLSAKDDPYEIVRQIVSEDELEILNELTREK